MTNNDKLGSYLTSRAETMHGGVHPVIIGMFEESLPLVLSHPSPVPDAKVLPLLPPACCSFLKAMSTCTVLRRIPSHRSVGLLAYYVDDALLHSTHLLMHRHPYCGGILHLQIIKSTPGAFAGLSWHYNFMTLTYSGHLDNI